MFKIEEAYKLFNDYVKDYDTTNPKVELKIKHTYSVVNKARAIAESLNIEQSEIDLACLIALLHDIGRFEQLRIYNSFYDNLTVDHADFGVKLLFEDKLIEKFNNDRNNDTVIYKAIKNHNKFVIESGLNERELMHAKIIRDADKIDNLEIKCTLPLEPIFDKTKEEIENQTITDEVYQSFLNHQTVLCTMRKTDLDVWLSHFAFVFDLNFKYCFLEILNNRYIDILYSRLDYRNNETKNRMQVIYREVMNYINAQIK